ncbi:MAG: biliverdin-producing heme oxygenase [Thermoanaerobaculia bacterium]
MSEVMEQLRDGTADLHQSAEQQDFQQRMFRATLRREEYAAWLGQMWLVHRDLEAALRRVAPGDARFAAVLPDHDKEPRLAADLAALGGPLPEPLPATARILARIAAVERAEPLRLLGFQYVLEGSANGNRILARRLLPALGLDAGQAGRYLDPYGERQREVWAKFKQDMQAVGFPPAECAVLVEAAREMFAAIADLSGDLSRLPAPAPRLAS